MRSDGQLEREERRWRRRRGDGRGEVLSNLYSPDEYRIYWIRSHL